MKRLLMGAAAVLLSGQMALAAVTAEQLITDLQAQGYSWIEVKRGPTQIKVEAVRGTEKLEFVVDAATGEVLARELERADSDEIGRMGVEISNRTGNFVSATGRELDDDDDDDDDNRGGTGTGTGTGGGHGGHGSGGQGSGGQGGGHSGDDDDDDDDDGDDD